MKLKQILEARVTFSSGGYITLTISEDVILGQVKFLVDEVPQGRSGTGRIFDEFPRYYGTLPGAKGQASKIVGEKLNWSAP